MTRTIEVKGPNPYTVTVGSGLSEKIVSTIAERRVATVALVHQPPLAERAEELAAALAEADITTHLFQIPDAEAAKTLSVCEGLWDRFAEIGMTRHDAVLCLGGGAATDLGGFVAAGWMRGIKVFHVPTTLLAMVDAAVGGKTGVNTQAGKNLVGAFHEPGAVFVDTEYLLTVPQTDLVAGSAEIIKTGFIADEEILSLYEADARACLQPGEVLEELIYRSIRVKAAVVGQDLKESGLREILNYGHTFAHAVERYEDYQWRHGDAVAVGMAFIAELAHGRGLIDDALRQRHFDILRSVGLPTRYAPGRFDELMTTMSKDKKNRANTLRFVSLEFAVGKCTRIEDASEAELRAAYEKISEG